MSIAKRFSIIKVEVCPLDIPVTDPFVVATGQVVTAQNLFVRVTLGNGSHGYGEIAPFPDMSGEDQASSLVAVKELADDSVRSVCASISALRQIISGNGSCSSGGALRAGDRSG